MHNSIIYRLVAPPAAISLALSLIATPALADPPQRDNVRQGDQFDQRPQREAPRKPSKAPRARESRERGNRQWNDSDKQYRHPVIQDGRVFAPPGRTRFYRHVIIVRPYGHRYSGYGFYTRDDDAYKWLAFTAITLAILHYLNEQQQRTYENAQIQATSAPVGTTIHWNDGSASGTVTATRDGTASDGRYCREFQQTVTIGGRTEQAYGIACRQPDGAWQVISSGQ